MKKVFCVGLFLLLLLGSGCVPFRSGGTTHYLVLGIGLVSVNSTNEAAARVIKSNVVGVFADPESFRFGYSSFSSITVNTNQSVLVEVDQTPGKPVTVCVPSPR